MTRRVAKGTSQLAAQLDTEVLEAARAFAKTRKETLREVLEMALRRHMANPPPLVELPPLPPLTVPEPEKPAPKRKGKK